MKTEKRYWEFSAQSEGGIGSADRCKPSMGASAPGRKRPATRHSRESFRFAQSCALQTLSSTLPSELRLNLCRPRTIKFNAEVHLTTI
jgi:hypothetical protein